MTKRLPKLKVYQFTEKDDKDPEYQYDFAILAYSLKEAKAILRRDCMVGMFEGLTVDEWIKKNKIEITIIRKPDTIMTRLCQGIRNTLKPMTKGELLKMLENCAKDYRKKCVDSIIRNKHMNDLSMDEETPSQEMIDAILVDFINYVGLFQGLDYGLYTHYLKEDEEK